VRDGGETASSTYAWAVADAPIGIFDSGYGGLTVARAVLDQLPHESVAYFGDTARAPYGPRPIAQTRELALECLDRLVDHGVKVLVIACNTASAAVLHDARERYDVPVVEVIRPAVRRAAAATRNGRVGVVSTRGTHQSGAYLDAFAAAPQLDVTSVPCPRFVELVEAGVTSGPEVIALARDYLAPLVARDVDTLVLGCTHYPLLAGAISYVMGDRVTLVSSADETAKDVYRVLADTDALRPAHLPPPSHGFTTTGDAGAFRELARRFLGPEVADVYGGSVVRSVAVAR
jgi:glutamate racemase